MKQAFFKNLLRIIWLIRKEGSVSKSCDTLSDSYSVSSEDLETFLPRIIRPRR